MLIFLFLVRCPNIPSSPEEHILIDKHCSWVLCRVRQEVVYLIWDPLEARKPNLAMLLKLNLA